MQSATTVLAMLMERLPLAVFGNLKSIISTRKGAKEASVWQYQKGRGQRVN